MGFKNIQSGERIKKVPDSPANSPDTCGRKVYPERKSCGFKNIRIRVDGGLSVMLNLSDDDLLVLLHPSLTDLDPTRMRFLSLLLLFM